MITPLAEPCADPFDVMLPLRVARWVLRHYANDFGTFDHEQPKAAFVNRLQTRWSKRTTTADIHAAVDQLTALGAFHVYDRQSIRPGRYGRSSVQMLRPSKVGCKAAEDQLNAMRLATPNPSRTKGTFVPNYMAFVLKQHNVPAHERRACATYIIDHVVRPYLEAQGYPRLPDEQVDSYRPRGPVAAPAPVVVAQQ
ncbi:hypothetical protein CNY89_17410, partial [Amaricoccus sp. HAR-UPW-R2A-40]